MTITAEERIKRAEAELELAREQLHREKNPPKWTIQYKTSSGDWVRSHWAPLYDSRKEAVDAIVNRTRELFSTYDSHGNIWRVHKV